jgi:hypothetical protein
MTLSGMRSGCKAVICSQDRDYGEQWETCVDLGAACCLVMVDFCCLDLVVLDDTVATAVVIKSKFGVSFAPLGVR